MATRLANLIGARDGVNVNFATPTAYAVGSLVVRLEGALIDPADISEIDPSAGLLTLADPPPLDAELLVGAYRDPVTDPIGQAIGGAFVEQIAELTSQGGNDFVIYAGQSGALKAVTIFLRNGARADLTGHALYYAARKDSESGTLVFDKKSFGTGAAVVLRDQTSAAGRGIADIVFTEAETLAASGSDLTWDLWVRTPAANLVAPIVGARVEVRASVRGLFPAPP